MPYKLNVFTGTLDVVNTSGGSTTDVIIPSGYALYFDDKTTDGSWRIIHSGNNLSFQRRESSTWVEKSAVTP